MLFCAHTFFNCAVFFIISGNKPLKQNNYYGGTFSLNFKIILWRRIYELLNLAGDFFIYTVLFKNSSNRQSGNFFIIQYRKIIRSKNTKEVFYAGVVCLQGWGCN